MVKKIQLVYMPENHTYMFLKEIHFETDTSGKIRFNANPVALRREEKFEINMEEQMVYFENFYVPLYYISKWLQSNDCIEEESIKDIGFLDLN